MFNAFFKLFQILFLADINESVLLFIVFILPQLQQQK